MIVIPAPFCNGVNSSRNPVISDNYENTGHRFSPVRRFFTKPSMVAFDIIGWITGEGQSFDPPQFSFTHIGPYLSSF